ncbi:dTDP-4-amino-4,6-dideoxygalactose transaminase [candidate division KSB1 bacterium]|nr:dTDP-4-amino-4,6-dideoxygalactose transaminase [candidate division KSB1 bacterium]
MKIPFNKPAMVGNELEYIQDTVNRGQLSGNGFYTKQCHAFFESRYGFPSVFLTTSGTDALEMAALLLDLNPGDEIILPSFAFVSTANAFALRGAQLRFADSESRTPNLDAHSIESLITEKTRAIVLIHYGGVACDMDAILSIARKHSLVLIEDAAQAIDACYQNKPLGSLGHMAAFSFHETKNVISGEGGLLVINDVSLVERAELIWEKGTNRAAFFRGEIGKYEWMDLGSSFLASELTAAYLYGQLEHIDRIQNKRLNIWNWYQERLQHLGDKGHIGLPFIPDYAQHNGHIFYILCSDLTERNALLCHLRERGIRAIFHYLSLHKSPYFKLKHDERELPNADRFMDCLIRLPMYYEMTESEVDFITKAIFEFYRKQ